MGTTAAIRPIEPADLPGLRGVIDAAALFPSEMLEEMTASYFDGSDDGAIWLTQSDGATPRSIVFCVPEPMTDGTWNVLLIAVHPAAQRGGLGAALMRRIETDLGGRGQRLLIVETSGLEEFDAARRFYRRLGYEQEARIRDFYAAGEDKIVFRKDLTRAA